MMIIWTLLKLNTFSSVKGTVMRIKRETIGWEKIFVEHMSDKGLLSKTQNSSKTQQ